MDLHACSTHKVIHTVLGSYRSTPLMWKTTYLPGVDSCISKQCPTHKPTMIGLIYIQYKCHKQGELHPIYVVTKLTFQEELPSSQMSITCSLLKNFHKPSLLLPKKTSIFIMGCRPTGKECRCTWFIFSNMTYFIIKPTHCLISESGCREGGVQKIINH